MFSRVICGGLILTCASWASGSPRDWDPGGLREPPRNPVLVYERLPTRYGGGASDTDFINMYGNPSWQQQAEDVLLGMSAVISRACFWGFYDQDNPPASETMRLRIYAPRESDGLPGEILYEESFLNPSRMATGRIVFVHDGVAEYLYDITLSSPFAIAANTLYWWEFVQVGDQSTAYRWEFGYHVSGDYLAYRNAQVPNWASVPLCNAFQLWTVPEPASFALLGLASFWLINHCGRKEDAGGTGIKIRRS